MSISEIPPFLPTQISGCQLWLDGMDAATVILSGNKVSQWRDKSVNGYHATQATSANQPTYSNSKIVFTSVNQTWMNLSQTFGNLFLNNTAFHVFIVAFGSGSGFITGETANVSQNLFLGYAFMDTYQNPWYLQGSPPVADSVNSIHGFEYTGSGGSLYQNGASYVSKTGALSLTSFTGPQIGRRYSGVNVRYHDHTFSEIIAYTGVILTPTQRQQVEGYLAWKWGLVANLPFNHPNARQRIGPLTVPRSLAIAPYFANFSPLQIPGCQLWLDAADSSTVTETLGTITNVRNKGNSSIVLSNANGFTYDRQANAFTNTTASSGRHLGVNSTYTQAQPQTLFAVAAFTSAVSNPYIIDSRSTDVLVGRFAYSIIRNMANTADVAYVFAGNGNAPDYGLRTGTNIPSNTRIIHVLLMNDAGSDIRLNGTTQTFTQNPGTNTMTGITVANRYSFDQSWIGAINEILLFNRGLTLSERQQIESYLAQKWALTTSLPAAHLHRSQPAGLPASVPRLIQNTFLQSSTIPFMYASGFTWYDTRNLTTTIFRDRGPNAYNGTMNSQISSVAGPYSGMRALAFSSTQEISCPPGYTSGSFTISYWVYFIDKAGGSPGNYQYILSGGRVQVHQYVNRLELYYDSQGSKTFTLKRPGANWTHIIAVYNTVANTITIYENGIFASSSSVSMNASGNFSVGSSGSYFFQSYLADIRIVPIQLNPTQALIFYNSYLNGNWSIGL